MTQTIGSAVSLICSIKIDDNIPLPAKRQKKSNKYEPEVKYTQAELTKRIEELQEAGDHQEVARLTANHLRWRVTVARWRNNERIL